MSEVQDLVKLGRQALARGERLCMATVVDVEGSAYRKPGARMLLASGGGRAGTISGGCLEAEVSRKAWWLTGGGARLERYSSFVDEDGGMPYGLGCGGVVTLLLEQGEPVHAVLRALEHGLAKGLPSVVVHALGVTGGEVPGTTAVLVVTAGQPADAGGDASGDAPALAVLYQGWKGAEGSLARGVAMWAQRAGRECTSFLLERGGRAWKQDEDRERPAYFVEYLPAPPALTVFGAGDDAQPIAALAQILGWRVTVADGRAHLAQRERFPQVAAVRVLNYADPTLRAACGVAANADWQPPQPGAADGLISDELAVVLTHSYEQDRALLAALLPRPMRYLGILGPRHRTERLLAEVTPALGMTLEEGLARLHSPIGLDLGSGEPAAVALSIVAEVQAVLHGRHVAVTRVAGEKAWERLAMATPDA